MEVIAVDGADSGGGSFLSSEWSSEDLTDKASEVFSEVESGLVMS